MSSVIALWAKHSLLRQMPQVFDRGFRLKHNIIVGQVPRFILVIIWATVVIDLHFQNPKQILMRLANANLPNYLRYYPSASNVHHKP